MELGSDFVYMVRECEYLLMLKKIQKWLFCGSLIGPGLKEMNDNIYLLLIFTLT